MSSQGSLSEQSVIERCDYLVDRHLWALARKIDYRAWLSNFLDHEKKFAAHLLSSFLYFSAELTEELFAVAFHRLSKDIVASSPTFRAAALAWNNFHKEVVVVRVPGETASHADSAFIFLRIARDRLGMDEQQLVDPDRALGMLLDGSKKHLVFVDDFVGSGQQFLTMWTRNWAIPGTTLQTSFAAAEANLTANHSLSYCASICTRYGYDRIQATCRSVKLSFGNVLSQDYCACDSTSEFWPSDLKSDAQSILETASIRAGTHAWKGFHDLGLAIAFAHKVPDATLPIFTVENSKWRPLIKA